MEWLSVPGDNCGVVICTRRQLLRRLFLLSDSCGASYLYPETAVEHVNWNRTTLEQVISAGEHMICTRRQLLKSYVYLETAVEQVICTPRQLCSRLSVPRDSVEQVICNRTTLEQVISAGQQVICSRRQLWDRLFVPGDCC